MQYFKLGHHPFTQKKIYKDIIHNW